MIAHNKTTFVIFAIVVTLGILTVSTLLTIQPVHALTKFFNCTTAVANKTHSLTLQDVNACYNKEFHASGGSLHHHDAIRTSIHSPSSSSEGSHRASSQNEGFHLLLLQRQNQRGIEVHCIIMTQLQYQYILVHHLKDLTERHQNTKGSSSSVSGA